MSAFQFLLLEANLTDAEVVQATLMEGGINCELLRVETCADFIRTLETDEIDLILADYALSNFDEIAALTIARRLHPNTPFIFISGSLGEELAIEVIKQGATDYVLKQRLGRLVPSVQRALQETQQLDKDAIKRKQALSAIESDLKDTQLLHELSVKLVTEGDIQTLYQEIMAAAIALTRADAGTVQILDEATQELLLLANQGFEQNMTEHFYRVNASSNTPCGIALRNGDRTFLDFDVPKSEDPNGSMQMHVEAGYFSAQSTPLITRFGKPIGMFSTHWRKHHRPSDRELRFLDLLARQAADLIEQRQAQVALRESQARLQSVANLVPDLLWNSEPDGSTNWYNQRWMEYTGQTFDEAIGWGWIDAIHPDDREASTRRYREAVEQSVRLQQEHRIRRHDGEYRWFVVNAFPLKDESGKVVKIYGAATDIHEQRVALEALRESEEKYRTLFESIDEGFYFAEAIFDAEGRCVDIFYLDENPAAVRMIGQSAKGRRMSELAPYEQYWPDAFGKTARTGQPQRRKEYAAPDGIWYEFYVFKPPQAQENRFVLIFRDVTERRRSQKALRESEAKY
ncbi:MAG: PAS domain S-box protein [Nostoc sp.]|uniref:PAS domain S-box protein n=1 Tax=Nostoc sp. TaxID=1180 RepID=UPI002FF064B0